MTLKINKACDLSSISVLPPQSRRANSSFSGAESSVLRRNQASMLRSQSQQSFSQGMSLSQLSQNSFDDILKLSSEDQPSKRISCLAPTTSNQEEADLQLARPSTNVHRRRNATSISEQRYQSSENIDHRIGSVETNLSRLGNILDYVQSDVMQVNRSVKELTLEMESIKQKMILQDNSLQLILKGEEDLKASLDKGLRSANEHLEREHNEDKLHEINSTLSSLPNLIESQVLAFQSKAFEAMMKEMKEIASCFKPPKNNQLRPSTPLLRKSCNATSYCPERPKHFRGTTVHATGGTLLKDEKDKSKVPNTFPFIKKRLDFVEKQEAIALAEQEYDSNVMIESDEEMDRAFSCLFKKKEPGEVKYLSAEVTNKSMHVLRKARRKRKAHDIVILD